VIKKEKKPSTSVKGMKERVDVRIRLTMQF